MLTRRQAAQGAARVVVEHKRRMHRQLPSNVPPSTTSVFKDIFDTHIYIYFSNCIYNYIIYSSRILYIYIYHVHFFFLKYVYKLCVQ